MSIDHKRRERGSALVYILIAIALLAALTATFMDSSSQQTTSQNKFNLASELKSQANLILSTIDECILVYPQGDSALAGLTVVGQHSPKSPYPLMPNNNYLASPLSSSLAKDVRCPGNPGNSNDHKPIFGGTSGRFLPPAPKLVQDWQYYNHDDGVMIYTVSDKTDAYIEAAFKEVDESYSACQAQYIDARAGDVTFAYGRTCWAGTQCLRIWISPTASATYNGEANCP
jgi:type II secretory pathway pseudopilin PulG